ncbi:phosphatidylinositol 4,5-bisphosphate 5-phosphatase A-like [Eurosta solidaginis]|uniref:phosphatidylinositol 4,5-bisphosphate 5-phosphatase A-like n=1 Tax=Eurosta solidaginis TaxID=178769 RepID=UPI0035305F88
MDASIIANLCVYILTWNVGTHHPDDISMTGALSLDRTSSCPDQRLPDIYVVGLQEVSTHAKNQLFNIFHDDPWTFKVSEYLIPYDYIKVSTEQLQGILVMMFAQPKHEPHIKDVEVQNTRTGLRGLWGNKGAVSIRMTLYGTGVTFVGAHLAAHDQKLAERIEHYNQIVNNHHYKTSKYRSIFDHDCVFWFGDLNFRLTGTDSARDVRSLVEQGKLDELIERDQLLLLRKKDKEAFALLTEQLPTFPPTFKFIEGTSEYKLKRRPAWCDRILHRVQELRNPDIVLGITQLSYKSHPDYVLSDHKPVSAEFLYKIEAQTQTDDKLYELMHRDRRNEAPLANSSCSLIPKWSHQLIKRTKAKKRN